MLRWFVRIVLGLVGLLLVAVGVVYLWSQVLLSQTFEAEPRAIAYTEDPEELARGERLAQVYGCFHGCHGSDMEGDVPFEDPLFGKAVAPNLTRAVRDYTPEQFEAIVRQGVFPDGSSVMAMPSASFSTMTDRDLGAIYSFISAYPEQPAEDRGSTEIYLGGRLFFILGEFTLAQDDIQEGPWPESRLDDPLAHGAYLAQNVCSECHGMDLEGSEGFTPPLAIAKAYDRTQFGRLMATGVGLDEARDLGLMALVAQSRTVHMTDEEVDALYAYLNSL